ncbi:MAG TPA: hypothetical protein VFL91_01270 [Thermomicrobiales bacterium]|nr:hypothetical protein [Thermomicrobiales bacterium]
MDDDFIVTAFVIVDNLLTALGHRDDVRAKASDAEVLTVAVLAAKSFQNHLARALQVMHLGRYLSGPLSESRFNRRLHALRGWLGLVLETLGAVFARGDVFLIDSMPVPVCRRARAWRCQKARGGPAAAGARPRGSASSAGGCTSSARPPGCRSPSSCCRAGCRVPPGR